MATVFEATEINGMQLDNRLMRSATWEGMADLQGRPGEKLARFMANLAKGGVGLIITGYQFVRPEGKQLPGQTGIQEDGMDKEHRLLTGAVHEAGGTVAAQLVHVGGQTDTATVGRRPLAPSEVDVPQFPEEPEALSVEQIEDIVRAFADGARRAKDWGYDAVQLHAAHGYLINQFLSPLTNRRNDAYGGTPEKRRKFLLDVYQAVRDAVGPDYPVLAKCNAEDNIAGGLRFDEALEAMQALSGAGIDAIEVSAGTPASGDESPARADIDERTREAYHLDLARKVKQEVECPVGVVGGIRSYEVAEAAVGEHGLDYVSLARPLIREPGLPRRWKDGDRAPAKCISCNGCFGPGLKEGGIACVIERKTPEKVYSG
jgi:2,4-dienoyl-CoA reductase-like NADH-dependent reductase (Old Yellow Enzyme family)